MAKKIIRVVVLVIVLGGGVWFWRHSQEKVNTGDLVLYGNIDVRQVELAINDSERIAKVFVEEGDRVKKGQELAVLELERFQLAVNRAQAQVDSQKQVVARLVAGSREEEIRKARADVEAARADERNMKQLYERKVEAVKSNAVSRQEVEDAKTAYEADQARVKALQAALDLVVAGPRKEDIAQAKALLKLYEVQLAEEQHFLSDAHLYAPSDGVIQERVLEPGDMASPLKTIYTMALTSPVWVRAYVSEPDLGKIYEGMKARVSTDSFPGKEYAAWIGFISPTAEFTPKPVETSELRSKLVYQARVFVENPLNELRLGMPATVHVDLEQEKPLAAEATEVPPKKSPPEKETGKGEEAGK